MDFFQRIQALWDDYLRQELSPAGVEELVTLLGRADAEEALTEPMRRLWEELKSRPVEYPVDWDRMYREVSQSEEGLSVLTKQRGGGFWDRGRARVGKELQRVAEVRQGGPMRGREVWGWRAMAAAFLGLAGLAAYWSISYHRPGVASAAAQSAGAPSAVVAKKDSVVKSSVLAWQTAENKKVIHLPDGSVVVLNRHSTLSYPEGTREVTLNGEAYFDVVHRPERPFLVHAGKILTRVLGTAFNIKAYTSDRSIEVTVDHGKVQVLNGGANMGLLSDKQQIRYDVGTENFSSQRVSLKPVIAWKPVEISFDDITMDEAARRIGERFKVGFQFAHAALKGCRITATFYMEDDLNEIMTVICAVNQSTYVIDGNLVKIDGKGCN